MFVHVNISCTSILISVTSHVMDSMEVSIGTFRLDYEYEIEYEYGFRTSKQ